jgi:hypothetical protein
MRILVTGDREWTDEARVEELLTDTLFEGDTLIHGAARGADTLAGEVAKRFGNEIEAYPADWKTYGKAAGVLRNQQMLDTGVDLCLAFHNDLRHSKGTKDMVKRCTKAGIPTLVVTKDHVE